MKKKRAEILLSLPSYSWLVLFFVIPTLLIFTYAFKPYDPEEGVGAGWTLETITSVFSKDNSELIIRTLVLGIATTIICVLIALPLGYGLVRASTRFQRLFIILVIMPFWSSFLVRIFAWKTLLHPEGFLKKILVFLHLIEPQTLLLYNTAAVLIVMVYSYLPFAILPIYAQSVRFNYHLIEAALDLGASEIRAFCSIFCPSIYKAIATACVMVFVPAIGAYVIPDIIGGSHLEMIGNRIAQKVFVERNLPFASALSVLLCIVITIPLLFMPARKKG
jgi:spermidine/putrescine transport system permease protein